MAVTRDFEQKTLHYGVVS